MVALNRRAHLDYGHAVTSHSCQGQTADRVFVHIDLERAGEQLVNQRLAYVSISRGRFDAPQTQTVVRPFSKYHGVARNL
jgi:ATP-dependent exoDNAse (exonuclease V) alpha subunit